VRLFVSLGLLKRGNLGLGQKQAVLRHFGFEGLQAQLHRGEIVPLPHAAYAGWRDRQTAPSQRLRDPPLAPGRLLNCHLDHRAIDLDRRAVLQGRLTPG